LGIAVITKVVFRLSVTKDGDNTWEGVGVFGVGVSEKGRISVVIKMNSGKVDGYLRVEENT